MPKKFFNEENCKKTQNDESKIKQSPNTDKNSNFSSKVSVINPVKSSDIIKIVKATDKNKGNLFTYMKQLKKEKSLKIPSKKIEKVLELSNINHANNTNFFKQINRKINPNTQMHTPNQAKKQINNVKHKPKNKRPKSKVKLRLMRRKINDFGNKLNNPPSNLEMNEVNTDSWFDIKKSDDVKLFDTSEIKLSDPDEIENDGFFTKKIKVYPTARQKHILLNWLDSYIEMYNATTKYFKKCRFEKIKVEFRIKQLKKIMGKEKTEIMKGSIIKMEELEKIPKEENDVDLTKRLKRREKAKKIPKKSDKPKKPNNLDSSKSIRTKNKLIMEDDAGACVDSHILDYAINDALIRYQGCLTNLRNGNIRHFRLRYLKSSKPNNIFKMEKSAFSQDGKGIYVKNLGKILKCEDKKFNYYKHIITMATLKYDKINNEFTILIKYAQPDLKNECPYSERNEKISIDLGIRTFMTGYASNGILEIGTSEIMQKRVMNKLKEIDKINNNKVLTKRRQRQAVSKRQTKISNMIKDVHWKSADYLTKNYIDIVIGNFSTKTMGEGNTVTKMTKRIGNAYSIFQFKQILKYKCFKTGTNYKHIDEAYTSKCCSKCGYYDTELGSKKRYNCKMCKNTIKRDVNGAKNILALAL